MATVITNLLSAIPVFGPDIVELIWGGFPHYEEPYISDGILKILFDAKTPSKIEIGYEYNILNSCLILYVKKPTTRGQLAEVKNRRFKTSILASQRLNTGNLIYAYLVGLIEGDGYFSITKNGKYIKYELGIELSIRDAQLIFKIKKILGLGKISLREREGGIKMICLRIRNKSHLIKNIIPIFDKFPLISKKQYDYLRFREAILKNIIYFEDLPLYKRPNNDLNSIENILNLPYFSAWLIGFIEAEGCFSIYKPISSSSKIASFEISQTNEELILLAIKKYLSLTPNIILGENNNYRIKISSVRSIENIIKFVINAPVKLLGFKKLQFLL